MCHPLQPHRIPRSMSKSYRSRPAERSEYSALYGLDPTHLAQLALADATKATELQPGKVDAYEFKVGVTLGGAVQCMKDGEVDNASTQQVKTNAASAAPSTCSVGLFCSEKYGTSGTQSATLRQACRQIQLRPPLLACYCPALLCPV